MATINIPNTRTGNTVVGHVRLKDGSMLIPWSGFSDIRVDAYSVEQRMLAARCAASIDTEDGLILNVTYSGDSPQYLGLCKLIVRGVYGGRRKTYDCFFVNFVAETAEATGVTVVTDPEVDVLIDVQEVSTSVLDEAIAAALAAADKAEHTASLAPYIDETTGTWWVYNPATDQYEDSGVEARGPQGVSPFDFGDGTNSAAQHGGRHTASGDYSVAEGRDNTASGYASHAEGRYNAASGIASHAEGEGTQAKIPGEHAEGLYNVSVYNQNFRTIHSVGIGHGEDARKNAILIDYDGRHYVLGVGGYQGTESTRAQMDLCQDLASVLATFVSRTTSDLVNYYTKTQTYTKSEVENLIRSRMHYEIYPSLEDITDPSTNTLYLIGPTGSGADKYEEYIYVENYDEESEEWEGEFIKIGDASIDLSGYVTTEALNAALSNYTTTTDLNTALNAKADKSEMSVTDGTGADADKTTIQLKSGTSATVLKSHIPQDDAPTENSTNNVKSGGVFSVIVTAVTNAISTVKEWANGIFAKKDGYYERMGVALAKDLEGQDIKVEDFTFTPISCADGLAKLNGVRGKSLVWNQLIQNGDFQSVSWWAIGNVTYTVSNGEAEIHPSLNTADQKRLEKSIQDLGLVVGHKYYFAGSLKTNSGRNAYIGFVNNSGGFQSAILNDTSAYKRDAAIHTLTSESTYFVIRANNNDTSSDKINAKDVFLIDLTLEFGIGKEPSTVAEFERWYYLKHYAFNPGSILNNKTAQVEEVGFNQIDMAGLPSSIGVGDIASDGSWHLGAPLPLGTKIWQNLTGFTGQIYLQYEVKYAQASSIGARLKFSYTDGTSGGTTSIPGANFHSVSAISVAGKTVAAVYFDYGSNIESWIRNLILNFSDPARNGQYEPYKKVTIDLNLTTLTGKKLVNGSTEGQESVVVYPDGMRGVGDKYDEAHVSVADHKFAEVDLGDLSWQLHSSGLFFMATLPQATIVPATTAIVPNVRSSKYVTVSSYGLTRGDEDKVLSIGREGGSYAGYCVVRDTAYSTAADFKAAMSGVKLIYQLATPEQYVLDTPLPDTFQAYKGGTMKQIPENTSEPTTAPCVLEVTYALDAVGILTGLPQDYVSKESLQAMLAAMQSAGIFAGYTMTWDATTGKYEFTFTANS